MIQGRAMGEVIERVNLPIGIVVTSPSCRARQTADLVFGGYDNINHTFMHRGPYLEEEAYLIKKIKEQILKINVENNKNAIISAHNGVIVPEIFDKMRINFDNNLEEGGFYVISKDKGLLILEGYFNNFQYFHKEFERRQEGN